jgi:hypothetical protein
MLPWFPNVMTFSIDSFDIQIASRNPARPRELSHAVFLPTTLENYRSRQELSIECRMTKKVIMLGRATPRPIEVRMLRPLAHTIANAPWVTRVSQPTCCMHVFYTVSVILVVLGFSLVDLHHQPKDYGYYTYNVKAMQHADCDKRGKT